MNKTNLVLSTLALAAVGGRAVAQTANAGAEDQRPNILYIMCDDHAMQCISAYGSAISKLAPTPNIDRLAQRGMLFNNCFVENSLSAPSRACLSQASIAIRTDSDSCLKALMPHSRSSQKCCTMPVMKRLLLENGTL